MRTETPEPWLKLMEARGYSSLRNLAEAAGLSHPVVSRMVKGITVPKDESVNAIAKALSVRPAAIYDLVKVSAPSESGPWRPPAEAARLTTSQREALTQLIRTMVAPEPEADKFEEAVDHGRRAYDLAANKGASRGRAIHEASLALGEESQDHHEEP